MSNKAATMAKIEASIRRKVKTYLTKQKRERMRSNYNYRTRSRRKTRVIDKDSNLIS